MYVIKNETFVILVLISKRIFIINYSEIKNFKIRHIYIYIYVKDRAKAFPVSQCKL